MATTPPPPTRIHTPPTPLHGPRYDNFAPYSPRRSSRVAAQRKNYSLEGHLNASSPSKENKSSRSARSSTPTGSRNRALTRTSSQTFSPPSSPASPSKHVTSKTRQPAGRRRMPGSFAAKPSVAVDSDSDSERPTRKSLNPLFPEHHDMLPTPSKTPRKRPAQAEASLSSTARVLFPGRPATIEDAMPSPRKARSAKRHAHFTLQSFIEGDADEPESSKIQIYTDSKERVPEVDEDEENPFITRKKNEKAKAKPETPSKRLPSKRKMEEQIKRAEEAMRNDEGMIYVFRGKKVFRRFEETDPRTDSDADSESDAINEQDIQRQMQRQSGAYPRTRLTRSAIKPRLLFPNEEQRRAREAAAAEEADEEAVTDIEVPLPRATGNKSLDNEPDVVTPVNQRFRNITPPSTGRSTRSSAKKDAKAQLQMEVDEPAEEEEQPSILPPPQGKKTSPFDSWRRTKPGSRSASATTAKGTKREGSPIERGDEQVHGKRTRSGVYHASSAEV